MSGFKENIAKPVKWIGEKCGSAKTAVMDSKPVKFGLKTYKGLTKRALSLSWMRTYYGDTRDYAEKKLKKRFRLTDEEMVAGLQNGFAKVMRTKGQEKVLTRMAIGRILLRATMSAAVSCVCDLPQFGLDFLSILLVTVAFLVDVIFFQRQIFLMIQELEILYVGRDESEFEKSYETLQQKQEKVEANGDSVFKAIGWVVKNGLGYAARLFRQSLKRGAIQVLRALGVRVTNEMAETTTTMILTYVVTSVVAGIVTYVMFLVMGWRVLVGLRGEKQREM